MATSKDVARLAGVSQSTVSYVMSGARSISEATRTRVENAMKELSYQPNASARALASRRTNVLGLVLQLGDDTAIPSTLPFIRTITREARRQDYDVVLVTGDEGPRGLERLAGHAIVDGMILMDITSRDPRVDLVKSLDIPVVLIGMPDRPMGLYCVDIDGELAGRLAVQELAESGCSRVVLAGETPSTDIQNLSNHVRRFESGALQVAAERDLDLEIANFSCRRASDLDAIREQVRLWRDGRVGVVARVPGAIDVILQSFLAEDIAPGTEVPLVGLCTDDYALSTRVAVTNVSPEPSEIARLASDVLFSLLKGQSNEPAVQLVRPRLARRSTSGIFR
ncbi:LacI family DNA-binding transcriptional regulator [Arthrobacter sp. UYCu723]